MIERLKQAVRRSPWGTVGVAIAVVMCGAVLAAPLDPFSQDQLAELRRAVTGVDRLCAAGAAPTAVDGARTLRSAYRAHPDTKIPLRGAGQITTARELVTLERARARQLSGNEALGCRAAATAVLRELPADA